MQLLAIFFAAGIRVVPGHRDETVSVYVAHPTHVQSGHDEIHGQLTHVTYGHRRLEEERGRGEVTKVKRRRELF